MSNGRSDARPLIGVTVGDPAGVGPEIVIKALRDQRVGQLRNRLGQLKLVQVPSAGTDLMDLAGLDNIGIKVANGGGANAVAGGSSAAANGDEEAAEGVPK